MPITKATGYLASDGVMYATVEEAQASELKSLLSTLNGIALFNDDHPDGAITMLAHDLLNHKDEVLAILTTGPRSKPRARKAAGTTNPRRAARRASAAQAKEGFRAMREAANGADEPDHDPSVTMAGEVLSGQH